jgi:hypothetical protein
MFTCDHHRFIPFPLFPPHALITETLGRAPQRAAAAFLFIRRRGRSALPPAVVRDGLTNFFPKQTMPHPGHHEGTSVRIRWRVVIRAVLGACLAVIVISAAWYVAAIAMPQAARAETKRALDAYELQSLSARMLRVETTLYPVRNSLPASPISNGVHLH